MECSSHFIRLNGYCTILTFWYKLCLPENFKRDVLHPCSVGMRGGSINIRLRPSMAWLHPPPSNHPVRKFDASCLRHNWCYPLLTFTRRAYLLYDIAITIGPRRRIAHLYSQASPLPLQGNYNEAEPVYLCSMDVLETTLGRDHPSMAESHTTFANLLRMHVGVVISRRLVWCVCHATYTVCEII